MGGSWNCFISVITSELNSDGVVIELARGESKQITIDQAENMADSVLSTPDCGISRIIIIKLKFPFDKSLHCMPIPA